MQFDPFSQYEGRGPPRRQRFVEWFHTGRLREFGERIEPASTCLSIGCGTGHFEGHILAEKFETVYAIEPDPERVRAAGEFDVEAIRGAVPPIPFREESLDAIVAAGAIEHLPDEAGFLEDAWRCLRPGGSLYVTIPIEVGVGGWVRFLAKNFVHPDRSDSPNGVARYLDYSWEELTRSTPREKHGTSHRFYNYRYAVADLRRLFSAVDVAGWPFGAAGTLNLILLATARKG